MGNLLRGRSPSMAMVVLVLLISLIMQESISANITFGRLGQILQNAWLDNIAMGWFALRIATMAAVIVLLLLNRKRALFKAIIVTNALLTFGLTINMVALADALSGFSAQDVETLLVDVVFMAVTNILIFSIWYWIIDPPGVEETKREDEPWDFLFPQRGGDLPHYEDWQPRYSDYLYLAFTTSFAFSPTDTLPLSRRAKWLMLWQSAVSIVTLTGIASSAINILAGGS